MRWLIARSPFLVEKYHTMQQEHLRQQLQLHSEDQQVDFLEVVLAPLVRVIQVEGLQVGELLPELLQAAVHQPLRHPLSLQ
jgi:hypothetical protein